MVDIRQWLRQRHDVNLGMNILLTIQLDGQFARTNPLDKFANAGFKRQRILRLNQLTAHHAAENPLNLGGRQRVFRYIVPGDLEQPINDLLVF